MDKIAVLIPCYNEEKTIEKVINDFRKALPDAVIYVYNNNSSDRTAEIAKKAGAIVRNEYMQGKGNVIRRMFREVDAECYIMTDGDDTYPAEAAPEMADKVLHHHADMVVGDRLSSTYFTENKRPFHNFGNDLVRWLINKIFDNEIKDIMTGYRAFSRKFVKTVAVMSPGFQIETELTITALEYRYNIKQIPIQYRDRPAGSSSKLNTVSDGIKVLITLFDMAKDYRPLWFFTMVSAVSFVMALLIGIPVLHEFRLTHYITKVPSAILASSLMVITVNFLVLGLILDHQANINKKDHELYVNEWVRNEKK